MKAKMGFGIVALAGLAAAATAGDGVPVTKKVRVADHCDNIGYMYVNAATGDRIEVPGAARNGTNPTFSNNDYACNTGGAGFNFLPVVRNGIYDFVNNFDSELFTYGDGPAAGADFDCFVILYAARDIFDGGAGAAGFNFIGSFYNNDGSDVDVAGTVDEDVQLAAGFLVTNIRADTAPVGYNGWILTIDLSASPNSPFTLGDQDEDGDGLADIAWGYSWGGPAFGAAGPTLDFGPGVAVPGNQSGVPGPGTGAPLPQAQGTFDGWVETLATPFSVDITGNNDGIYTADEFRGGEVGGLYPNILGVGWFGGWTGEDCSTGVDDVTGNPHASLFIDLLITETSQCPPCTADYNSDTAVNSSDFLAFLNGYSAQDPCTDLAPAGGDSVWNSSDFLAFLNAYSAGC